MLLILSVLTSTNAQNKKDSIPSFLGVSYMPAQNWKVWNVTNDDGDFLKHKFDVNSQSTFEGNFGINKIGVRLGLSANIENNFIGKAYRYGGYIGYKSIWLRIQSSKVSGSVEWSGTNPTSFPRTNTFASNYFTIELLKSSKAYKVMAGGAEMNRILGTYWGIGYTTLSIPLKISTLTTPGGRENQKFGKPAYDSLFKAKYYTASFGFDILRQLCMTGGRIGSIPGKPAQKFGIYAATQDKIGFGPGTHSDFAVRMAEEQNPGLKFVDPKGFSTLVHYYLSVGFRYTVTIKPMFMVFAAGYDFEGAGIINFGGAADTKTDLGWESSFFYVAHGVTFKIYLSWIGK
ncbi:MAG TPA: hypothetical protein DIW31_05905 [Bacteroidales bacterium]|nr:hypothetical protein [Bacteroidales bacterium]